ncbi:MAG: transcription elongation factor GreA [Myxococcota bacterium]
MSSKVPMRRRAYEQLQEDLRRLKLEDRPRIVREIKLARELGDLSENAEYHAAKERQGHVEGRIRGMEDRLARAQVIDPSDEAPDRVRFGVTVVLEDLNAGEQITYTIVGEDEADVSKGLISVHSPVGHALIGKRVYDEVIVTVPAGTRGYEVREIRYD